MAALHLGAGRQAKGDEIDHSVGVVCHVKRGERVEAGEPLADVHARDEADAEAAAAEVARRLRARGRRAARSTRSCSTSLPELPEVESVRRAIAPALEGRRLDRVEIPDPRLVAPFDPTRSPRSSTGELVATVGRRGKYLIVRFDSGRALLIHLRMTGSLRPGALEGDPHRRALLTLDDGTSVAYKDVRRFGTWLLLEPGELEPYLAARLGEEPLLSAFTAKRLGERLRGRRAPLKAALLDQRTLAGLGNIYVDEALWYARLHPLREAGTLEPDELRRLHRAIRKALELGSPARARRSATTGCRTAPRGRCSRSSGRTAAPASRATAAARSSRRPASAAAAPGSALAARPDSCWNNTSLDRATSADERAACVHNTNS